MKKLTVIIPHYNDIENLNERCLKSLNELDTSLFDIIVVDDASPQPVIINNKYNNMNIKIITLKKNQGPGIARQAGIDASDSEWLSFIDSDDSVTANYEKAIKELDKDYDIIKSQVSRILKNEDIVNFRNDAIMHGVFYKKSFLNKYDIRFISELRYHEDNYFNSIVFLIANILKSKKELNYTTYRYYETDCGITSKQNNVSYYEKTFQQWTISRYKSLKKFYLLFPEQKDQAKRIIIWDTIFIFLRYQSHVYKSSIYAKENYYLCVNFIKKMCELIGISIIELISLSMVNAKIYCNIKNTTIADEGFYFIEEESLVDFLKKI